jgi:hypothetical protein
MTCLRVPVSLNTGLIFQAGGLKYVCNFRTSFCLQAATVLFCNKYYRREEGVDNKMGGNFYTHGGDEKRMQNISR